jgi:ankyrin repeat protein
MSTNCVLIKNGSYAHILASAAGHEEIVRMLLDFGANIEARGKVGI